MKNASNEWILDKIVKVEVPDIKGAANGEEYLRSLSSGAFAGSIRNLCMEDYCNAYV